MALWCRGGLELTVSKGGLTRTSRVITSNWWSTKKISPQRHGNQVTAQVYAIHHLLHQQIKSAG